MDCNRSLIIAIDGYSSCGKSTFAKAIAARLGYIFIDTGSMYRGVTLAALRGGIIDSMGVVDVAALEALLPDLHITFEFNEMRGASDVYLNGECVEELIRTMEVNNNVSRVSAIESVRDKLVAMQQAMGCDGGVVMDGRDIGTVVFPEADIKLFMQADAKVRAERRYRELREKGVEVSLDEILQSVVTRDHADETREISPLRRADDSVTLDNSAMSVEEQMEWFDALYHKMCSER